MATRREAPRSEGRGMPEDSAWPGSPEAGEIAFRSLSTFSDSVDSSGISGNAVLGVSDSTGLIGLEILVDRGVSAGVG